MSRFCLPQVEIDIGREIAVRQLLILGGRPPETTWLRQVAADRIVWAADSGADACRNSDVRPAHVLGDFDSIGEKGRRWLKDLDVRPELYPADKDYTDFQLCLNRIKGDLLVTGCWGRRFDHTFGNIFSALWGEEWGTDIRAFADDAEVMFPLSGRGGMELTFLTPPAAVSLLPLTEACGGVSIEGVRWELRDVELLQGRPYAISNLPTGDRVRVQLERGVLGIYCLFRENRLKD